MTLREGQRRQTPSAKLQTACVVLLLTFLLLTGRCSLAIADGDPASDDLLGQQVFTLTQSQSASAAQRQLYETVKAANRAGFAIRVAVISSSYDLGSVVALWLKPQTYARFLGIELSLVYKQRLLVVMPNGFGFIGPSHSATAAYRLLAKVPINPGEAGTVAAARIAVRRLAAAGGVQLPVKGSSSAAPSPVAASSSPPGSDAGTHSSSSSASTVLLIVTAAMLMLALILMIVVRIRDNQVTGNRADTGQGTGVSVDTDESARVGEHAAARHRARASGLRRLMPRVAAPFVVAVPLLVLALGVLRHGAAGVKPLGQPTPSTWAEGQRRAPSFELTNQDGRPVSPASFHGRPVIVTFIDPLCRDLCPLEGRVLDEVDLRLPVAERPPIIAVSVDVYADTHADLMQDVSRWSLVPQWHWAIGSAAQLAAVWKRYDAVVRVSTKRIAGATVHDVSHSAIAYLIDRDGYERALFSWPFDAKDVENLVRRIERL